MNNEVITIEPDTNGFCVRIGPLKTEDQARHLVVATLREMSEEGLSRADIPPNVTAAVRAGLEHLQATQGHFTVRVDGGPGVTTPKVDYSAGGTFRAKTA